MQKSLYSITHEKAGGEDKLIFFDEGTPKLPIEKVTGLHYHNRCEIGICIRGNGLWVMGDHSYAVSRGDIIVTPAGIAHYSRSITTTEAPACNCRFHYFDECRLFAETGIEASHFLSDGSLTSPVVLTHHSHGKLHFLLRNMIETIKVGSDITHIR